MAKLAGALVEMRLEELEAHPSNYRSHPEDQVARIGRSLEQHGQYRNVVVQASTNRIIAGHGVVEAAKLRGDETVLAMVLDVTNAEAEQILVDDNELPQRSVDDLGQLSILLERLRGTEFQPDAFDDEDVSAMLADVRAGESVALPEEFPAYDPSAMEFQHACPKCGYEWSDAG